MIGPTDCPTCGAPGCANGCVCRSCGVGPDDHVDGCPVVDAGYVWHGERPSFLHSGREPVAAFGDDPFEGLDLDSSYDPLAETTR